MLYRDAGGGTLRSSLGVIMSIGLAITIVSLSLSDTIRQTTCLLYALHRPFFLVCI